jgi:hypothetical protein
MAAFCWPLVEVQPATATIEPALAGMVASKSREMPHAGL